MIICDSCNRGWHTYCLDPVLRSVPPSHVPWLCPQCMAAGVDPETGLTAKAQKRMERAAMTAPKPRKAVGKATRPPRPEKAVARSPRPDKAGTRGVAALTGALVSLPQVVDWRRGEVLRHMGMLMPGAWEPGSMARKPGG
jgi:hypothetical protein